MWGMSMAEPVAMDRALHRTAPPTTPQPPKAVFVDERGTRSRWFTRLGRLCGLACAGYLVATMVLSLIHI